MAGDAAFTCGVSYEALNNVVETTKKLIVVLNDNEWSIAKNVGAMAGYFNRIATSPTYQHLHEKASRFIQMIGGREAVKLAGKVEADSKRAAAQRVVRGPRPALLRVPSMDTTRRCSSAPSSSSRPRTSR